MHGRPRELPSRLAPGRPTDVCTSRFCTCCSNLSITADTFCRSMLLRALSRALVTCAMFLVTWHGAVERQQDEGKGWRPPGTGPLSATQVDKPPGQAKLSWAQAAPAMSPGSAIDDPMDTRSPGHDTRSKSEEHRGSLGPCLLWHCMCCVDGVPTTEQRGPVGHPPAASPGLCRQ